MILVYFLLISFAIVGTSYLSLNKKERNLNKVIEEANDTTTPTTVLKRGLLIYSACFLLFFVNISLAVVFLIIGSIYIFKLMTKKLSYEERNQMRLKMAKTVESMKYNGTTLMYMSNRLLKKDTRTYTQYKEEYFKTNQPVNLFPSYKEIDKAYKTSQMKKSYKEVYTTQTSVNTNKLDNLSKDIVLLNSLVNNFITPKELSKVNSMLTTTHFGVDVEVKENATELLNELKKQQQEIITLHSKVITQLQDDNLLEEHRDKMTLITNKYNDKLDTLKDIQSKLVTILKGGEDNVVK